MTYNRLQLLCWSMMVLAAAGAHGLPCLPREASPAGAAVTPGVSFLTTSTPAKPTTTNLHSTPVPSITDHTSTAPTLANSTQSSRIGHIISETTTRNASTTTDFVPPESMLISLLLNISAPITSTPAQASTTESSNLHQVTPSLIEELRRKRNPSQTVPIMHAEDIGMCKFVVQEDSDPERTPQTIYTVTCRQAGCRCGSEGDYRCTQLTSEVRVTYRNGARNQVLYPNSGCICAAKEASDALSAAPQIAL